MAILSSRNIVNVNAVVSPRTSPQDLLNTGIIIGTSEVLDVTVTPVVEYNSVEDMMSAGFTTDMPEIIAAQLYFSQVPRPDRVFIGRRMNESWVSAVSRARNNNFTWLGLTCLGIGHEDILQVAQIVEGFDRETIFFYRSPFEPIVFNVSYSGTEPAPTIVQTNGLITLTFQSVPATDPVEAEFTVLHDAELVTTTFSYNGVTGQVFLEFTPIAEQIDTSVFSDMQAMSFQKSAGIYHGSNGTEAALMGLVVGSNTGQNNSAPSFAWRTLNGVSTSNIDETLRQNLINMNAVIYINVDRARNILENPVMADGSPIDEVLGIMIMINQCRTTLLNTLINARPKIPYTNAGVTRLEGPLTRVLRNIANQGFIQPGGQWTLEPIVIDGTVLLDTGDILEKGFGIYAQLVENVPREMRDNRIAPPITIAAKLTGAIEHVNATIFIDR